MATLEAALLAQTAELATLKAVVDAALEKKEGGLNATLILGLLTALVTAVVAISNQRYQAGQGRLLKAIELVMESRSPHQARMRLRNLNVFLDNETREHLRSLSDEKDSGKHFAGTEWTDLKLELAKAMSDKARTPQDVLAIWKASLSEKTAVTDVLYP